MEDKFEKLGPLLGAIGEQAAADLGGDPDGIYIYAEMGDRWYSIYLFRDEGQFVQMYWAGDALQNRVLEAWKAENPEHPDKRWSVMEYEILGNKFDAQFKFSDEVDVEDVSVDRRQIALERRYGKKPIIYPDLSGGVELGE